MANSKITQLNENTAPASGDLYTIVDDPAGSAETQKIDHDNLFTNVKKLELRAATELTISSGEITVTQSSHTVDTEGDAASDDLDTINGASADMILILRAAHTDRTVVLKDNTGNLFLNGDFSLTHTHDTIMLLGRANSWLELSRSDNTA